MKSARLYVHIRLGKCGHLRINNIHLLIYIHIMCITMHKWKSGKQRKTIFLQRRCNLIVASCNVINVQIYFIPKDVNMKQFWTILSYHLILFPTLFPGYVVRVDLIIFSHFRDLGQRQEILEE